MTITTMGIRLAWISRLASFPSGRSRAVDNGEHSHRSEDTLSVRRHLWHRHHPRLCAAAEVHKTFVDFVTFRVKELS